MKKAANESNVRGVGALRPRSLLAARVGADDDGIGQPNRIADAIRLFGIALRAGGENSPFDPSRPPRREWLIGLTVSGSLPLAVSDHSNDRLLPVPADLLFRHDAQRQ